jgi:flagellar biosynthesis protein FlhB
MPDRTEAPTPERLRTARAQGQVAQSRVVSSLVHLALLPPVVAIGLRWGAAEATGWAEEAWRGPHGSAPAPWPPFPVGSALRLAALVVASLVGGSVLSHALQRGLVFSPSAVAPDWRRLGQGLRRILGPEALVQGAQSLVSFTAAVGVAASVALNYLPLTFGSDDPRGALAAAADLLVRTWVALLAVAVGAAGLDWAWARRAHRRRLRMSKDEVRREHRRQEGDPQLKSQRRARARELAAGTGWAAVAKARAVVVNPRHVAVALDWNPRQPVAPSVIAKGVDADAHRIRRAAIRAGVPIVRHVALARSLHAVDLDAPIPESLYAPVAEVLVWLNAVSPAAE